MNISLSLRTLFKTTIGLFIVLSVLLSCASGGIENMTYEERYRLAGHPATTATMFASLFSDADAAIRKRVASNRKTPKNILLRLANDPAQEVKISLATNLSADEEIYRILAKDHMLAVRSVVARFEYIPAIALEILSQDNEVDIRIEVARNLNSTKAILMKLAHDTNDSVKAIAEQALQRLRDDPNP